ncbi:MAG: polysaccharide deacetylase family protein [Betaproteobacteria bacterium]|nr:polysaccharide deacetylase family protein [Betaproteobacteria bacterium]
MWVIDQRPKIPLNPPLGKGEVSRLQTHRSRPKCRTSARTSPFEKGGRRGICSVAAIAAASLLHLPTQATPCKGTLYLTVDTGHMGPAEEMAATLNKHQVKATFFLANERTKRGDGSLEPSWASYWKARASEGHAFGSHTWDHWKFVRDIGATQVVYAAGKQSKTLDRDGVCAELKKSEEAFKAMTGRGYDGLWRAPGGKTTPNVLKFAESCGFKHVGWSPAGFSGDELPSDKYPSNQLIAQQLRSLRDGDILLWHLGIWSRKDPLYPHLDALIGGLKAKGFCFAPMTAHPAYRAPAGADAARR